MHFPERRPRNDEERVLPLINVVFLLLIFFMLAGRLTGSDVFPVSPPQSASEGAPGPREMLVLVGEDGRVAINGDIVVEEQLLSRLAAEVAAEGELRVQLKGDARVAATRVVEVMEQLREAGVERLRLLTESTAP